MPLRAMNHNEEQIVWAEQTEIELENYLREFDETVWPVFKRYGYTKDAALTYWLSSYMNNRLLAIETLLQNGEQYD